MRRIKFIVLFFIVASIARANNLTITNSSLQVNPNPGYVYVQFDIAWDNSWRTSTGAANWDAAWIFIKYRVGSGDWQHAKLSPVSANHGAPTGGSIYATSDGMGAFVYRLADGTGNISFSQVKLAWNYAVDGVADGATIDFKVMGIEMVYVPQGSFWLGDGSSTNTFRQTVSNIPVQVASDGVTIMQDGTGTNSGDAVIESGVTIDGDGGICTTGTGSIDNTNFPTGFKAFYCMKYEASQAQYAAFLNLLSATQAASRYDGANSGTFRYTISGTWPNFTASAPDRACNFISVDDLAAYADWAGLRPMTELEYEKICRGTATPVAGEYVWGNTNIFTGCNVISNAGLSNEGVNAQANTGNTTFKTNNMNCGVNGPLRCGIFAASSPNKTRQETGSGHYGIMELSGNLWETVVSIGRPQGRIFTGLHGNGVIASSGAADVTNWPTNANLSTGYRGSSWQDIQVRLRTSDRYVSGNNTAAVRSKEFGIRCVRVASPALLATVSTNTVSAVLSSTATCGGNITADGGEPIIARGVCWSISTNPTLADNKTIDGAGSGTFSSFISGLTGSTLYHVRSYATSTVGTVYGNEFTFTTSQAVLPSITSTTIPVSTTSTTASSGGTISDEGGAITVHGVCWNTSANPTILNNKSIDGTGMGDFTSTLTGLSAETTYYVRAYATNSVGTVYGEERTFFHCGIGTYLQGGIVAYIYQPGDGGYVSNEVHGIIAAPFDQSTGIRPEDGAQLCYNLVLNGYDDWTFPFIEEVNLLYINRVAIGGFADAVYCSRSWAYSDRYWYFNFANGTTAAYPYVTWGRVRAIRYF